MAMKQRTRKTKKTEPELDFAVAYLRKSSPDDKNSKGEKKRQSEKSIAQQKKETIQLAKGRYKILDDGWYSDENTPGWKRGAKRPGFQAIMDRARTKGDFQAILVDNIDRFSRASFDDVQEDARALKKAGVRYIVSAAQGTFDLGKKNDIGEILKFAVAVWASHEYSRQLSRRVCLAQRNRAIEGKRIGSHAPYGMKSDGNGGLKPGKPSEVKVVQFVFDEFVKGKSYGHIVRELNRQGVKTANGTRWYRTQISKMLRRAAYVGDFVWNADSSRGQFFVIDETGDVVEKTPDVETAPIIKKNAWEGIVSRDTWNRAQKRLDAFETSPVRPRGEHPLSGVLICEACGKEMHRATPKGRKAVYRCSSNMRHGAGTCGTWEIQEQKILPVVIQILSEEMDNLQKGLLTPKPPTVLRDEKERQKTNEARKAALEKQIKQAGRNAALATDPGLIDSIQEQVTQWREQLAALADMQTPEEDDALKSLLDSWHTFCQNAFRVPTDKKTQKRVMGKGSGLAAYIEAFGSDPSIQMDGPMINAALRALGCEVRLLWETVPFVKANGEPYIRDGKQRMRNQLVRGRFRLGQRKGEISRQVLSTLS